MLCFRKKNSRDFKLSAGSVSKIRNRKKWNSGFICNYSRPLLWRYHRLPFRVDQRTQTVSEEMTCFLGNPLIGFPTMEQSTGLFHLPSWSFFIIKISLVATSEKGLRPLHPCRLLKKAGENFNFSLTGCVKDKNSPKSRFYRKISCNYPKAVL